MESLFTRSLRVYPVWVVGTSKQSTREVEMTRVRVTTDGGRPAKDKMVERRIAQENRVADAVMGFGKYRHCPVSEVDDGYLLWCLENMTHCPPYVMQELRFRGLVTSDYSRAFSPSAKQQNRDKKHRKALVRADRQRQKAKEKVAVMQAGIDIVGTDYLRLLTEFDRADGDAEECPFDEGDYTYTGPSICWVGGQPVITPSEFPKEAGR